jgi:viroplasmin and RNaseH domain-containing protein
MASRNTHYAYLLPDGKSGITESWAACEKIVRGWKGARYKGFTSRKEAADWLSSGALYDVKVSIPAEKGIYFDAGTGRGEGVEVSVTDEKGADLLDKIISKELVNKHGKHFKIFPAIIWYR